MVRFGLLLLLSVNLYGADADLGRRIYREGILASGAPLLATSKGDLKLEGTAASCANCHRRSGYGCTEGGTLVPDITARSLFRPTELRRADLFSRLFEEEQPLRFRAYTWQPPVRPAYTDENVAAALRSGHDPAGRSFDGAMPRYRLSDTDTHNLVAYLKTLSATDSPGVGPSQIHFATVIADDFDPAKRAAILDVMAAFIRRKNTDTARILDRRQRVAWLAQDSLRASREWVLHVWQLRGPPSTWREQLDSYYGRQRVFAVIAGGARSWAPVEAFCQDSSLPCLFPETDLPGRAALNDYTIYFHAGLFGEAESLARYLLKRQKRPSSVVQVYRDDESGRSVAAAFRRIFGRSADRIVRDCAIDARGKLDPASWTKLIGAADDAVLWFSDTDLVSFHAPGGSLRVYVSGSLVKQPSLLTGSVFVTHALSPFSDPSADAQRGRAWLSARRIPKTDEVVELNTYFTLTLLDYSLMHMVEKFSRDYLIESIERNAETALNPTLFPRLSLGPGQRFASKGDYITPLANLVSRTAQHGSEWIVP